MPPLSNLVSFMSHLLRGKTASLILRNNRFNFEYNKRRNLLLTNSIKQYIHDLWSVNDIKQCFQKLKLHFMATSFRRHILLLVADLSSSQLLRKKVQELETLLAVSQKNILMFTDRIQISGKEIYEYLWPSCQNQFFSVRATTAVIPLSLNPHSQRRAHIAKHQNLTFYSFAMMSWCKILRNTINIKLNFTDNADEDVMQTRLKSVEDILVAYQKAAEKLENYHQNGKTIFSRFN